MHIYVKYVYGRGFLQSFYQSFVHFFNKQPSCYGSNVKNCLKVKQLAKQPTTLKMPMQKSFV